MWRSHKNTKQVLRVVTRQLKLSFKELETEAEHNLLSNIKNVYHQIMKHHIILGFWLLLIKKFQVCQNTPLLKMLIYINWI